MNEAGNIAWVLEQVPDCVDEIVLVDGESTDATILDGLMQAEPTPAALTR